MNKKILIKPEGKESFEADLVMAFEIVETGSKYVVYTLNELIDNRLVKLYIAGLAEENGVNVAKNIETDEEWAKIKEIMKQIIAGGNV